MKQALISVILPVYNVEKYLEKCLDSIVSQTFKDIEIICINDGSSDSSLEILNEYAKKDERITIISQENQGIGITRNISLKIANGKYISFVDPDDWIKKDMLQQMYDIAEKENCDIVGSNFNLFYEETDTTSLFDVFNKINKHEKIIEENTVYNRKTATSIVFKTPYFAAWGKLYKKAFILGNNINFAPKKFAEDVLFTIKALFFAERICNLNKDFYYYRIRKNSLAYSVSEQKMELFYTFDEILSLLQQNNEYETFKDDFEELVIMHSVTNYENVPKKLKSEYRQKCKNILSSKGYKRFIKLINGDNYSFLEKIFSIKNERNALRQKRKVITVLGIKIKFPF